MGFMLGSSKICSGDSQASPVFSKLEEALGAKQPDFY